MTCFPKKNRLDNLNKFLVSDLWDKWGVEWICWDEGQKPMLGSWAQRDLEKSTLNVSQGQGVKFTLLILFQKAKSATGPRIEITTLYSFTRTCLWVKVISKRFYLLRQYFNFYCFSRLCRQHSQFIWNSMKESNFNENIQLEKIKIQNYTSFWLVRENRLQGFDAKKV